MTDGTTTHQHGHANGFRNFFTAGASFKGIVDVEGNAAVTTYGDGDAQRDQLFYFGAQDAVGDSALCKRPKPPSGRESRCLVCPSTASNVRNIQDTASCFDLLFFYLKNTAP